MTEYIPPQLEWVSKHVELYESSGGTEGTVLPNGGLPCIMVTLLVLNLRERIWAIAVAAFPTCAEYKDRTSRKIPVFLAEPARQSASGET